MSINAHLTGDNGQKVAVTERNQLVVAPLDFSLSYQVTAAIVNLGYNFITPRPHLRFVITDILLYANKGVGANDATVEIYEADSPIGITVSKCILAMEMPKLTSRDLVGLNLIVSEGKWLNIKTDDNTIFATVMGYYVGV